MLHIVYKLNYLKTYFLFSLNRVINTIFVSNQPLKESIKKTCRIIIKSNKNNNNDRNCFILLISNKFKHLF